MRKDDQIVAESRGRWSEECFDLLVGRGTRKLLAKRVVVIVEEIFESHAERVEVAAIQDMLKLCPDFGKPIGLSRKLDDSEVGSVVNAAGLGVGQAARSSRVRSRSTLARP